MKKILVFVIGAAAIVYGGYIVNQNLDASAKDTATKEASEAKALEAKMMEGFTTEDLVIGTGNEATAGSQIIVNYRGSLKETGKEFENSYTKKSPLILTLGTGEVIKGWDIGIVGMKVGGKRRLTIPPALGYGAAGRGDIIPPNATLVFDVELVEIR